MGIGIAERDSISINQNQYRADYWCSQYYDFEPVRVEEWQLVAFTNDGDTHRFYLNGQLTDEANKSLDIVPSERIDIGSHWGGSYFFDGVMDEIQVYNRALTAAEIRAIYEAGSAGLLKP